MEKESGDMDAKQPDRFEGLSEELSPEIMTSPAILQVDGLDIDDAIRKHLIDCDQCREGVARGRPVPLGSKSPHCDTYWDLQLRRAEHEGIVNNIVAYTELGDEAPVRGRLE